MKKCRACESPHLHSTWPCLRARLLSCVVWERIKEQNSLSCILGCGVLCTGGAEQFLKIKNNLFVSYKLYISK